MKTSKGTIVLEDSIVFSSSIEGVDYIDSTGIRIHIPMNLLIRLYKETQKWYNQEEKEKTGKDWDTYCKCLVPTLLFYLDNKKDKE